LANQSKYIVVRHDLCLCATEVIAVLTVNQFGFSCWQLENLSEEKICAPCVKLGTLAFEVFVWTRLIETLVKGGFGLLALRVVIAGARSSFSKRAREVRLAKLLRLEMKATEERVSEFVRQLTLTIGQNQSAPTAGYRYFVGGLPGLRGTYDQSYAEVLGLFEAYAPEAIQSLTTFHTTVHNYDLILSSYRDLYLKTTGLTFGSDPNTRYLQLYVATGLPNLGTDANISYSAIESIVAGPWHWEISRKVGDRLARA
jgi:hypothetical protein